MSELKGGRERDEETIKSMNSILPLLKVTYRPSKNIASMEGDETR